MGKLKEGVQYIYEKSNGVTYAREFGSTERKVVGIDYKTQTMQEEVEEDKLWRDIRKASMTNPALEIALERTKIIYQLSKVN